MEKIKWCMQAKDGIQMIEPNGNVANGYILKAEESLEVMHKAKGSVPSAHVGEQGVLVSV